MGMTTEPNRVGDGRGGIAYWFLLFPLFFPLLFIVVFPRFIRVCP